MNINRNNYEEFFLLYVDNELQAAERADVEAFAQLNPDLLEELNMLKEATLSIDEELPKIDKSILFKNEQAIGLNNYEEFFLLHVDNELQPKEKEEVEKFVLQHPEVQTEFTLLQQTKLNVEVIEFKNKEELYRTEQKERRVVAMRWFRLAVAAAFIGIVATLWFIQPEETNVQPLAGATEQPAISTPKKAIGVDAEPTQVKPEVLAKTEIEKQNEVAKKPVEKVIVQPSVEKGKVEAKKPAVVNNGNLNQLPEPENNPVLAQHKIKNQVTELEPEEIRNKVTANNYTTPSYANNSKTDKETATQHAVYRELDTEDDEESVLISGIEINKNKLRGLFKKASNLFDKKSKKTEGERTIHIASFEIKTK